MKFKISQLGVILVFTSLVAGCGATVASNNSASNNTNATTGTSQSATVVGDPAKGQQLFTQNCSSCHSTGSNTIVGPGLKDLFSKSALPNGQPVTEANIEQWISTGGGAMPSFPQLSLQDRANLAAYIKTLSN